jgi:hypothetical protein
LITFVLWKWRADYRTRFGAHHVDCVARMIADRCGVPCRVVCVTDDPRGLTAARPHPLWRDCERLLNPSGAHLPSCYRRLKLFDAATTDEMGVRRGDWVVSVDLDVVVCGDLAPLVLGRDADFVGWRVPGMKHEAVFNGSVFALRAGAHQDVWDEFDPAASPGLAAGAGYFGSDQGWISYRLPAARHDGWTRRDGVWSWPRELRFQRGLPTGARLVAFHGKHKPWDRSAREATPWVSDYWSVEHATY